jgi:hypothetical protein
LIVEREKPMQEVLPLVCIPRKIITELLTGPFATEKWDNPVHDRLEPLCDRISIGVRVLARGIGIENLGHETHRIEGESESHLKVIVLKIVFVAVGTDEMLNRNNMPVARIAPAPPWLHCHKMHKTLKNSENDSIIVNCLEISVKSALFGKPSKAPLPTGSPTAEQSPLLHRQSTRACRSAGGRFAGLVDRPATSASAFLNRSKSLWSSVFSPLSHDSTDGGLGRYEAKEERLEATEALSRRTGPVPERGGGPSSRWPRRRRS